MKKFFAAIFKNAIVINLLLAVVVAGAVLFGVLSWLDIYTRHNQAVEVPDVKGLSVEEAEPFFASRGLHYSIIDSVYAKDVKPGAIIEVNPEIGSKVKEGRNLYITINAHGSQSALLPELRDLSVRQAQALLEATGFEDIEIEYVPGEFRDLVIEVESNGNILQSGKRVALSTPIKMIVSTGEAAPTDSLDTIDTEQIDASKINIEKSDEETWF